MSYSKDDPDSGIDHFDLYILKVVRLLIFWYFWYLFNYLIQDSLKPLKYNTF